MTLDSVIRIPASWDSVARDWVTMSNTCVKWYKGNSNIFQWFNKLRQTYLQTDMPTDRHAYRQILIQTDVNKKDILTDNILTDNILTNRPHRRSYRHTFFQTDVSTDRCSYRQTFLQTDFPTDTHYYRQCSYRQTFLQTDIPTDKHSYRQTFLQTDFPTDRQPYRQTFLQTYYFTDKEYEKAIQKTSI